MEKKRSISASPHIRGTMSTASIMQLVLIALLPAGIFGVFHFGSRALLHILVSVVTCVLTEFTYEAFTDRPLTVGDFSAAVTGLLLALTLPVGAPLWIGAVGGIFAILVVKMLFGGIGQNIVNPALAARCFLALSFGSKMSDYACDAVTGPTPLVQISEGLKPDLLPLLLGSTGGAIGETSVVAILIGVLLLLGFGIINLRIPASCLLTFSLGILFFGERRLDEIYLVSHLLSGGLMLGVWFMATDYVTSPVTKRGQLLYGGFIGATAAFLRLFGKTPEGLSYAILLGNLLTPLIEKATAPRPFGKKKKWI